MFVFRGRPRLHPCSLRPLFFLSLCHCSRKWFLPQVGGAARGKRKLSDGEITGQTGPDRERGRDSSRLLRPVSEPPSSSSPLLFPLPVTLEQRRSAGCVVFVSQGSEESQPGPRPRQGALHVCLERVGQLELWLQDARSSRASAGGSTATMQDSVERQLLTCQVSSAHSGSAGEKRTHSKSAYRYVFFFFTFKRS